MDAESSSLTYEQFKKEVLSLGAEACLPANLTDDWIHYIDAEMSFLNCSDTEDLKHNVPCIFEVVVKIINAKNGGGSLFSSVLNELFDKTKEFEREIALEIFRRRTKITCEPATLDNIFTNRTVGCWKI